MISMILAADEKGGIGYKNGLPWPRLDEDMRYFRAVTENNVVVMGSNTWESLGRIAPLKNRTNYVITSKDISHFPGAFDAYNHKDYSMEDILIAIEFRHPGKETIVVGGKTVYDLAYPYCDTLYLTRVADTYKTDTVCDIDKYTEMFERRYQRIVGGTKHSPAYYLERWERK